MIYVVHGRHSLGGKSVVKWLGTQGVQARGGNCPPSAGLNSLVIGWGKAIGYGKNVYTLNPSPLPNKYIELIALKRGGVPHVAYSLSYPGPGWYGRTLHHSGGKDFLEHDNPADFFTQHVEVGEEFRVHVFQGQVIKVAKKVPNKEGWHHPYIRNKRFGWRFIRGEGYITQGCRAAGVAAVAAVGYDFGAVDVGIKLDTYPVVFEVNSAPRVEGSSVEAWGTAFLDYYRQSVLGS